MAAVEATVGVDIEGTEEEEEEEDATEAGEGEAGEATGVARAVTDPEVGTAATAAEGVTERGAELTCSSSVAATGPVASASAVKTEGEAKEAVATDRRETAFAPAATAAVCGLPLPAATRTQEVPAARTG